MKMAANVDTEAETKDADASSGTPPVAPVVAPPPPRRQRERCPVDGCARFLAPSDMPCRCKRRFCMLHRHPESHACTYDFKLGASAGSEEARLRREAETERMRCDSSKHNIERI